MKLMDEDDERFYQEKLSKRYYYDELLKIPSIFQGIEVSQVDMKIMAYHGIENLFVNSILMELNMLYLPRKLPDSVLYIPYCIRHRIIKTLREISLENSTEFVISVLERVYEKLKHKLHNIFFEDSRIFQILVNYIRDFNTDFLILRSLLKEKSDSYILCSDWADDPPPIELMKIIAIYNLAFQDYLNEWELNDS